MFSYWIQPLASQSFVVPHYTTDSTPEEIMVKIGVGGKLWCWIQSSYRSDDAGTPGGRNKPLTHLPKLNQEMFRGRKLNATLWSFWACPKADLADRSCLSDWPCLSDLYDLYGLSDLYFASCFWNVLTPVNPMLFYLAQHSLIRYNT